MLELRPLRWEDQDALYAVASDPLIWDQHPASDRHEANVFKSFFADAMDSGGALAVVDTTSGEIIGSTRFHGYDPEQREVEIGWTFLAQDFWGGQYNREMKQLMLAHAFKYVDSVIFRIGVQNLRSQKATEKIGATRVGTTQDAAGNDSYVYRIRRSET